MSRFPPIPPSDRTPEQEAFHKDIDVLVEKAYGSTFTLRDSEGSLLGPFGPLLYGYPVDIQYSQALITVQLYSFARQGMGGDKPPDYENTYCVTP
jgi:hypothetical protein